MNRKEELMVKLAGMGIIGEALEPAVDEICASIPKERRGELPDDRYEAAAIYLPVWQRQQSGETEADMDTPPLPDTVARTAMPAMALSTEAIKALQSKLDARKPIIERTTKMTRIIRLITDQPVMAAYVDPKTVLSIKNPRTVLRKMDEDRPRLVRTRENIEAFETLYAAVQANDPLYIYLNPSAREKIIGVELFTIGENGEEVTKILTKPALIGFLTTKVMGYIPTHGEGTIGCKIRFMRPRNSLQRGNPRAGVPNVTFYNRAAALEDPALHLTSAKVQRVGDEVVMRPKTVRSDMSYLVKTDTLKSDGTYRIQRKRISGRAELPKLERINGELTAIFGLVAREAGQFVPDIREQQEIARATLDSLAAIAGEGDTGKYGVGDIISQVRQEVRGDGNMEL